MEWRRLGTCSLEHGICMAHREESETESDTMPWRGASPSVQKQLY